MNEYKPEIDGLRAIAVVLVLLSHVQLGITGGFIGVDVFFVISGFLITSIIISGIEQNNFSFIQFYGRRFVRLYPALLVMIAATLSVAFVLADSLFYAQIARSAKYAIASVSNIYFSKHIGYFDLSAQQQPFLHTWTLGVEWQFYLLTPLLIWVLLKHSKEVLIIGLSVVVGVSVVLSQVQLGIDPNQAYYLMPYRAFELGIGSLLVFIYQKKCPWLMSVLLTLTGLIMILAAGIIYSPQTPFPGYAALLPTIGAALCIYGGQSFVKGNLLRLAPIVYIGKISYSVYLVHWPIIVFAHYILFYRSIYLLDKIIIFIFSLVLGALLHKFVEAKITWKNIKRKFLTSLFVVLLSILGIVVCQWVYKHPQSLNWRVSSINSTKSIYDQKYYPWIEQIGDLDGRAYAVLLADSMGYNYAAGLDEQLQNTYKKIYSFFRAGCYMIDDNYVYNSAAEMQNCMWKNESAFSFVDSNQLPLILAQAWEYKNDLINNDTGQHVLFSDLGSDEYKDFLRERLTLLRLRLRDRKLILVASPPYKLIENKGREYIRPSCSNRPNLIFDFCSNFIGEDYRIEESFVWELNQVIREFAETHPNTYYIDPSLVICPNGVCNTRRNDEFYRPNDMNHFSVEGSRKVAPYVWQEIQRILNE